MRALLALAFLFSFHAFAQNVPIQAQAHAGDILQSHRAWGDKMNTKDAKLTLKEVSRKGNNITAQFYAEGLPKKWIYSLMSFPIGGANASILLTGITLDADGRAVCSGKPGECGKQGHPNAPVTLRLAPGNGEPLRFALMAKTDQTVRAALNFVPFPLSATDKGCKAEAVILEPGAGVVHIEASGFPAGATVTLSSDANGKTAQKQIKASAKGEVASTLMPSRGTEKQGTMRVQLTGPACAPSVTVPWSR
jgi:hypothetical protein